MFDASKNLALKCQPSFFSVNFLDIMELSINTLYGVLLAKDTQ